MTDDADAFARARELDRQGRDLEAQRAYLSVLDADPAHLGALTNLAALMERRGHTAAALQGFKEAAARHPRSAMARINFGAASLDAGDLEAARREFEAAVALAPEMPQAHQGLAAVFLALGDEVRAQLHLERGYAGASVVHVPCRGAAPGARVLLLLSARGGNVDLRQFLDERRYEVWKVFVDAGQVAIDLPLHDVVVNAIGDADRCSVALARAADLVARTDARVLNEPAAVLETRRLSNARRFAGIPGVRAPRASTATREQLLRQRNALQYPLLLRAPGFHAGEHAVRVDDAAQLETAMSQLPGANLLAIEYVETRGDDGLYRKYRVMAIGGTLYPLHVAIGSEWMLHYLTSQTPATAAYRAEEERFLRDMDAVLGSRAIGSLEQIASMLDLDYAGIDFALDRDGNIVVFEANATMTIPRLAEMPDDDRRPAIARAHAAVEDLLLQSFSRNDKRKSDRRQELSLAEKLQLGTLLPEEQRAADRREER